MSEPLVLMGIDPGFKSTGYGIIKVDGSRFSCLDYGVIQDGEPWPSRLWSIYSGILDIVSSFNPDEVAVEEGYVAKNAKVSLKLGHVRGAVMLAPIGLKIPVFEYTPLDIKKSVSGYGRAEKSQIKYMVKQLLHLDREPEHDDSSDALALCICHANNRKMKLLLKGQQ